MKQTIIVLYLLGIVLANVITANTAPLMWGKFIVPAGSFLIGATFILRDLVQNVIGRRNTYMAIGAAMLISGITSYLLGDTLWITAASALTFLLSETTDTEIYTRLKLPMSLKVLYSGLVGGALDSVVFVIIGLSPIGAGFLPWEMVGYAIAGQIIVKTLMQLLGSVVIQVASRNKKTVQA
ncbi:VUT family protein [Paenibacillus koleovorans]|uniref:VUT family protein n=1 Tax=Paenibacillus koleovorans TaxID=121608 RepID=UPI000FD6B9C0|nr:VUT family protein [Paenibacillus koleovorans]